MKPDPMINVHMIKIKLTKDGGHYALCSCGWRSFGSRKVTRASAESAAQDHAKAIPRRKRSTPPLAPEQDAPS